MGSWRCYFSPIACHPFLLLAFYFMHSQNSQEIVVILVSTEMPLEFTPETHCTSCILLFK